MFAQKIMKALVFKVYNNMLCRRELEDVETMENCVGGQGNLIRSTTLTEFGLMKLK